MQHFRTTEDLPLSAHHRLTSLALKLKRSLNENGSSPQALKRKTLVLLFQKPSTRTRLAFETGIRQLGGNCIFMTEDSSQLVRGEQVRDTARVISSMVQAIVIRSKDHKTIEEFAFYSSVPIINALSSDFHPCQLLADIMTFYELRGSIKGKKVVWCGDGNNVCRSYIQSAKLYGFKLHLAIPAEYLPPKEFLNRYRDNLVIETEPEKAIKDADLVCTDVWVSMGDKNAVKKRRALKAYQVTQKLLDRAKDEVLFMHCLPAQEGKEVADGLLDDPRSAVWQQAENRLHSQKALLIYLFK